MPAVLEKVELAEEEVEKASCKATLKEVEGIGFRVCRVSG